VEPAIQNLQLANTLLLITSALFVPQALTPVAAIIIIYILP
jgi:hypothetical protein